MAQNDKNVVTEDKVTFRLCDDCLGVNLKTLINKLAFLWDTSIEVFKISKKKNLHYGRV